MLFFSAVHHSQSAVGFLPKWQFTVDISAKLPFIKRWGIFHLQPVIVELSKRLRFLIFVYKQTQKKNLCHLAFWWSVITKCRTGNFSTTYGLGI